MLARQTKEGQRLLDGFLNPGGQARTADRPFSQPRGEIGLRLIKVAAIIEPSKLGSPKSRRTQNARDGIAGRETSEEGEQARPCLRLQHQETA